MFKLTQREKNEVLANSLSRYHYTKEQLVKALAKGGDPNQSNYNSPSLLFPAVDLRDDNSSKDAVDILLKAKIDITKTNNYGQHALHYAVIENGSFTETIKRLMEEKFDLNTPDTYGRTPLFDAILRQHWTLAGILMDAGGTNVTMAKSGKTLLTEALLRDAPIELVRRILETKVDINATSKEKERDTDPMPALSIAATKPDTEYLDLLLTREDIKLEARSKSGKTPLLTAVIEGNKPAVAALLKAGASTDTSDSDETTPLTRAVSANNQDILEMLIEAKAPLDKQGAYKKTAITIAAANGNIPMVMTLLGAAEKQDVKLGLDAALMAAAEKGYGRILELLINAGADVNISDEEGRTPLMKAALSDQIEPLNILMKAGAKPDVTDRRGMSPYDHAVSSSKMKSKDFLGRYRTGMPVAQDKSASTQSAIASDYGYTRLNDHSLEVREGDSLTMTFNFWTQQVVYRDAERAVPLVVQSFTDIPRQEAITEAWNKLKEMGGNPPDPHVASVQKKSVMPGLTK